MGEINGLTEKRAANRKDMLEINKAFQVIHVLGQVLRAYPTRLDREEKIQVAEACYRLNMRVLGRFAVAVERAENLIRHYFRRVAVSESADEASGDVEGLLRQSITAFVHYCCFMSVRRVARSVGSVLLKRLYGLVQVEGGKVHTDLVNMAIQLELLDEVHPESIDRLYQDLKKGKQVVAARVVQRMVWEHLMLHPVDGGIKTSLVAKLDLKESPGMLGSKVMISSQKVGRKRLKGRKTSRKRS